MLPLETLGDGSSSRPPASGVPGIPGLVGTALHPHLHLHTASSVSGSKAPASLLAGHLSLEAEPTFTTHGGLLPTPQFKLGVFSSRRFSESHLHENRHSASIPHMWCSTNCRKSHWKERTRGGEAWLAVSTESETCKVKRCDVTASSQPSSQVYRKSVWQPHGWQSESRSVRGSVVSDPLQPHGL